MSSSISKVFVTGTNDSHFYKSLSLFWATCLDKVESKPETSNSMTYLEDAHDGFLQQLMGILM
jgi:hypothetical protein